MPVPARRSGQQKNIWVAAGDGDLDRVQELIEQQSFSPNVPDTHTYTPMHAAASYGHIHILEYLVSRGGNVNVEDLDGDTPLYVVENVETARWLVEHGAVVDRTNGEGSTPAAALSEDFPEVTEYLESVSPTGTTVPPSELVTTHPLDDDDNDAEIPTTTTTTTTNPTTVLPSQHAQNQLSETLATGLMERVRELARRAEEEGREPDEEELRRVVGGAVWEGMVAGFVYGDDGGGGGGSGRDGNEGAGAGAGAETGGTNGVKRPRTNGS